MTYWIYIKGLSHLFWGLGVIFCLSACGNDAQLTGEIDEEALPIGTEAETSSSETLLPPSTVQEEAKAADPSPQPTTAVYVIVTEENEDTLEITYTGEGVPGIIPFRFADGKLRASHEAVERIKTEIQNGQNDLFTDAVIDLSNFTAHPPLLFVEYTIRYNGKGRQDEVTRYYIFTTFPARIIPISELDYTYNPQIKIKFFESISLLNAVRFPPLEIQFDLDKAGDIRVDTETLASSQEKILPAVSKQITIEREAPAPIKKGALPSGILETVPTHWESLGTTDFSTQFQIKNMGKFDEVTLY